jgi:hypothetical protein
MSSEIEIRRFEKPDQILDLKDHGHISIVRMADGTAGMRAIFEPGWTWEADEKPLLGSPASCPMRHTGYCFSGKLVVRMLDSGVETRIGPGDFFEIRRAMTRTSRARNASNSSCSRRPNTSIDAERPPLRTISA